MNTHTNHFPDAASVELVKKRYIALATELHPALGGDAAIWLEVETEYHSLLKQLDRSHSTDKDGKDHQYFYDYSDEAGLNEMIGMFFAARIPDSSIALVGKWLWVSGTTRDTAHLIKSLTLNGKRWSYSGDKEKWFFHLGKFRKYSKSPTRWENITKRYGYNELSAND
jgi:hypothetical protein